MKTYLKLSFWCAMLFAFAGAYILASGKTSLIYEDGHLANPQDSYIPLFTLALSTFIFCALLKLYIDFRERKNNKKLI